MSSGKFHRCVIFCTDPGFSCALQIGVKEGTQMIRFITATVVLLSMSAGPAEAQVGDVNRQRSETLSAAAPGIRKSAAAYDYGSVSPGTPQSVNAVQASSGNRRRSVGRIVAGAAVGAVGGFFGGGFLGAVIEGDKCHCDDPGLLGAVIGAPIGAVAGGILGGKLLF
jgi:hypothetical protein